MADVFISFSHQDAKVAKRITDSLKKRGVSVFLDSTTLVSGDSFRDEIARAISSSRAVIVLLSGNAKRSKWVEQELQNALAAEKLVIPVLMDSESKQNWVWPLIADRVAFQLTDESSVDVLAASVCDAIGSTGRRRFRLMVIIAVVGAVLGALGAIVATKLLR